MGGAFAIVATVTCILKAAFAGSAWGVVGASIYGASLIVLYAMSSVYHGLRPSTGKKVMQVLDHCAVYFLIGGTYTPIMLCAVRPVHPAGAGRFSAWCGLWRPWPRCSRRSI